MKGNKAQAEKMLPEYDLSGGVRGKYLQQHLVAKINAMADKVVLHESEEGFAVSCPALPGCWSQGADEDGAIANIRDAIREYLVVGKYLHGSIQPN